MKTVGIVLKYERSQKEENCFLLKEEIVKIFSEYKEIQLLGIIPNENLDKLRGILEKCDGFLLPDGEDWQEIDEYVAKYAVCYDLPLLAVGVGFQALCSVYSACRKRKNMAKKIVDDRHWANYNRYLHGNYILPNTLLYKAVKKKFIMVNSCHHDYVTGEFRNLKVTGVSEDGIIEAVEMPGKKFIIGIQWRIESLNDDNSKALIDSFISSVLE